MNEGHRWYVGGYSSCFYCTSEKGFNRYWQTTVCHHQLFWNATALKAIFCLPGSLIWCLVEPPRQNLERSLISMLVKYRHVSLLGRTWKFSIFCEVTLGRYCQLAVLKLPYFQPWEKLKCCCWVKVIDRRRFILPLSPCLSRLCVHKKQSQVKIWASLRTLPFA